MTTMEDLAKTNILYNQEHFNIRVLCVNTLSPMHGLHNIIAHTNGKVLLVSTLNDKCHEVTLMNNFLVISDKDSLAYTSTC